MKAISFEVTELGVASEATQKEPDAPSDPVTISFGQVCTPALFCWTVGAD